MRFVTHPRMLVALVPIVLLGTVVFAQAFHIGFWLVAWRAGLVATSDGMWCGLSSGWLACRLVSPR